jgi:hypothetical protein
MPGNLPVAIEMESSAANARPGVATAVVTIAIVNLSMIEVPNERTNLIEPNLLIGSILPVAVGDAALLERIILRMHNLLASTRAPAISCPTATIFASASIRRQDDNRLTRADNISHGESEMNARAGATLEAAGETTGG